ncbi:hypothetical protein HanRHA438_Chr05g0236191 [Helianthus annuus]|nr:hypothetical protein HanRHA438_Chr05g0236191 [Helianthus annuus]
MRVKSILLLLTFFNYDFHKTKKKKKKKKKTSKKLENYNQRDYNLKTHQSFQKILIIRDMFFIHR